MFINVSIADVRDLVVKQKKGWHYTFCVRFMSFHTDYLSQNVSFANCS